MKNGILACLVISIIIALYELYWFLYKGSELGLVLALLSFVVSYICFYLWREKWKSNYEKEGNLGIFSYLRDALSGKIYKKNVLIGDNTVKLFEKASQLSDESFIKRWVIACIISIHGNLEEILFGKKGKSIATIKKNLNILDIDKVYEIIKILVCYYISATKMLKYHQSF